MSVLTLVLDCSGLEGADMAQVDALARLRLQVAREGCELQLAGVGTALSELVRLAGLEEALGLQPRGQAPEGEEPLGVEEERQLGDQPA